MKILALDFDGVICDGLKEYFATSKETYHLIWGDQEEIKLEKLRAKFYQLRPVVETGWEMPLIIRALILGISPENILKNWSEIVTEIIKTEKLDSKEIGKKLDNVRDNQIKNNLENWLNLHQLYPGITEFIETKIKENLTLYIISTKEGRFIKEILKQEGLKIPENHIIGKECQRKKHETLTKILRENNLKPEEIIFIEDRIEPLEKIHNSPELQGIKLYLATWGYNTEEIRKKALNLGYINLLNLDNLKLLKQN